MYQDAFLAQAEWIATLTLSSRLSHKIQMVAIDSVNLNVSSAFIGWMNLFFVQRNRQFESAVLVLYLWSLQYSTDKDVHLLGKKFSFVHPSGASSASKRFLKHTVGTPEEELL